MAASLSRFLRSALLPASALLAATPAWAQTPTQVPATTLDPVTAVATRTERSVTDIPASVDVINQEQIERRVPSTIGDVVRDVPGVTMDGGPRRNGEEVNIRGFGGQRVLTSVDGVRQNFEAGHKGRFFIDPDLLKQVEVLKGPASAIRGSGAVGGVLSLTTKDAADFLEGDEKFAFKGKYGYRTAAREPLYSATHAGRPVKEFDYLANLTYRYGGTIRQGGSRELVESKDDLNNGLFKLGVNPADNHRIGFSHQFAHERGDLPNNAQTTVSQDAPAVHRTIRQETNSFSYSYKDPGGWLNPNVLLYQTSVAITDDRKPPLSARRDQTDFQTDGLDIYNTSHFVGDTFSHAVTYGFEYFLDEAVGYRNGALRPEFPRGRQDVQGYYVQDEIKFGAFSVIPGVRYDIFRSSAATAGARETDESQLSPRLGGVWRITSWAAPYASYAQGFRAPSILEQFVGGTHHPGNVFQSNPDLKPESTETYEAGARLKFDDVVTARDQVRVSSAYFRTHAESFIELTGTSGTVSRYVNIPNVDVDGYEAQTTWDAPRAFAGAGVSRIRGTNESTGGGVNSIPADKLTATAGGKVPEYDLIYGVRGEFARPQRRVGSDGTPTAGYNIYGLFASWQPDLLRGLRIDGGVDNLFDKSYRRHASSVYSEGRDFYGAVSYVVKF